MSRVTVLMAVYDGMPHLPAAVESIRSQTLRDWRMVIVDDGSPVETGRYLDSITDSRIEVLRQDNRGLAAALNHGLGAVETEFVARMDDDDIALPSRLERQLQYLDDHPEIGLLGTQVRRLGSRRAGTRSACALDHQAIRADLLSGRNQMYHPTVMARTSLVQSIGGYWEHPRGEEWDLFLRMSEVTRLANLDEPLLMYRLHARSMTGSDVARMRAWVEYACYRGRCREQGREPADFEAFDRSRNGRVSERVRRGLEMRARNQYRIAMAELLGETPVRGAVRLVGSALLYFPLATKRLKTELARIGPGESGRPQAATDGSAT